MMESAYSEEYIRTYLMNMPKVELHAHLNGSLSHTTLEKLILLKKEKGHDKEQDLKMLKLPPNDLSQCFETFNLVHKVTDSPEAIYIATCDVIEDFYKDGVSYLELRTTPKDVGPFLTQEVYVETVLKAIDDTCARNGKEIDVRLLLSVDRKRSVADAEKTMKTAEKLFMSSETVVGLDFSGDPTVGDVRSFVPILESVKKRGLKLSVHIAEVPHKFDDVENLLNVQPDRLGHGTYLLPCKSGSTRNFDICKRLLAPLEICLTSNIISKTVPSYEDHHFKYLKEMDYPCILCTDDKGVFNTTLSNEYYLAHKYYSLSKEDLYALSFSSIDHIFAPAAVKKRLREKWSQKKDVI